LGIQLYGKPKFYDSQNEVQVSGISKANIKVNYTILGGGFGRKAEPDYVRKAGTIAKQMSSIPIQTVFTREETMSKNKYRPAAVSRFRAVVLLIGH